MDKAYPAEEIHHFRAFCSVYLKEPKLKTLSILFGASDKSNRFSNEENKSLDNSRAGIQFGFSSAQWEQHLEDLSYEENLDKKVNDDNDDDKFICVGTSSSSGRDEVEYISINYSKNSFIRFESILSLRDFDDCLLLPFLNLSLAKLVKRIHIIGNGYKLHEVSKENFYIDESNFENSVPVKFDDTELGDKWVRIRPKGSSAFRLSFSEEIPVRMFTSHQTKNSHPIFSKKKS